MPLTPGTRLGPYEIIAPLGAGGMGEVYRARDSRLGREVAVKVLPQHLSSNPEVRARFEREAKTVSGLNHPNICVLHDVGREGDTDYLVMELIEGETLAARLAKGALPAADVLRIGSEIAEALDRAHRAGVVHRDLKPGNVMLTRTGSKLMDFGLARSTGLAGPPGTSGLAGAALTQSPTMAQALTAEGTIIGTYQYMAPEQLEGREADARSDIWALGCVLYEMATGRRAFDGRSQASLISSIMKEEPAPIPQSNPGLAAATGLALEHLVRQCLAKDPEDRWQSAGDLKRELAWIASAGSGASTPSAPAPVGRPVARRGSREAVAWILAALGLGAALVIFLWFGAHPHDQDPAYLSLPIEEAVGLSTEGCDFAISPDGRRVAFVARDSAGTDRLWCRALDSPSAAMIRESEGASTPFWSPDSRSLAYFSILSGRLRKVSMAGGSPVTLTEVKSPRGGSWSRKGVVVFAPAPEGPLLGISAEGGEAHPVTVLDATRHQTAHRFPCFLPDGDHFLFAALPPGPQGWDIFVGSLGSKSVKKVMVARCAPVFAEPGYLLFVREGKILAQRFDSRRLEVQGDAVPVADAGPPGNMDTEPVATASRNGRLVYRPTAVPNTRLQWLDRNGSVVGTLPMPEGPWTRPSLSPDGRHATFSNGGDIWEVDLDRPVPTRLTSSGNNDRVIWSGDGSRLVFFSNRSGPQEIYAVDAGGGEPVLIPTTSDKFKSPLDWTRDGRYLVFGSLGASTDWDIWVLPMFGDRKPVPFLRTPSFEQNAKVSPDGRCIAYESTESGQYEVYVQSFPSPGHKIRISTNGGAVPSWSQGGRELIYYKGSVVMSVPLSADGTPGAAAPRALFTLPVGTAGGDMAPSGDRYLVCVPARDARRPEIRLVLNWTGVAGK